MSRIGLQTKGKGAKVFPDQVSPELRSLCFARKRNPIRRAGRFSRCSQDCWSRRRLGSAPPSWM